MFIAYQSGDVDYLEIIDITGKTVYGNPTIYDTPQDALYALGFSKGFDSDGNQIDVVPESERTQVIGDAFLSVVSDITYGSIPVDDIRAEVNNASLSNTNTSDIVAAAQTALDAYQAKPIAEYAENFAGRFLLDPNEVNGFGYRGFTDEVLAFDVGEATAGSLNRNAGGFSYPWDMTLREFRVQHRNSNAAAIGWGWVIAIVSKTAGTNAQTTTFVVHELQDNAGVGPRDYANNTNQETVIDLSSLPNNVLSAGDVLFIGVATDATAPTTNYYVECMSGYIHMERY